MKYAVSGSNKATGARMSLEFEAESKGAAERKAAQSGMTVHHVRDITDGYSGQADPISREGGGRKKVGLNPLVKLILLVAILGIVAYFAWPYVRGLLHR